MDLRRILPVFTLWFSVLLGGGINVSGAYIDGSVYSYPVTDFVVKDDASIVAWATGYRDLAYGSDVNDNWKTPERALGPAVGSSHDIVCLGRGGQITLTFTQAIRNGTGADFCVFENGFSDTFLELAWVEVSTDGVHFVRFPNFSLTLNPTASNIRPDHIFGLASRYRQARGTPFDLDQIRLAAEVMQTLPGNFSLAYRTQFQANYSHLDLNDIRYVRLIDIVGDGSALDTEGYVIYDAYPTTGSAGFDLEAVGVLNRVEPAGLVQVIDFPEIDHQHFEDGSVQLLATASSGLPVEYALLPDSPAMLVEGVLTFSGTGTVQVLASQPGDADYITADPILRTFVIAEALQHIYFEPIANQVVGATGIPLSVVSSSGLPVQLEVASGPADVSVLGSYPDWTLHVGATTGTVTLRAWLAAEGDAYAPADDVEFSFEVVSVDSMNAPHSFEDWQTLHTVSGDRLRDSDGDGANDFLEYVAGTDPWDATAYALPDFEANEDAFIVSLQMSRRAPLRVEVLRSINLLNWSASVPEIISVDASEGASVQTMRLRLSREEADQCYWRCRFDSL